MPDGQQIHVRVPDALLDEMNAAKHALGLRSVAELVRRAVEEYLGQRKSDLAAYKRLRSRASAGR